MLGSLILYLKGMRIIMFQLSGFYYKLSRFCRALGSLEDVKEALRVRGASEPESCCPKGS